MVYDSFLLYGENVYRYFQGQVSLNLSVFPYQYLFTIYCVPIEQKIEENNVGIT